MCLFFFLVTACSLAQTPTPGGQLDRLQRTAPPILATLHGQGFVGAHTRPGERVVILGLLGHRIGLDQGVVNVSPYSNSLVIALPDQLDETIAMLRSEGGTKVFVDLKLDEQGGVQRMLEARGFAYGGVGANGRVGMWVDQRAG